LAEEWSDACISSLSCFQKTESQLFYYMYLFHLLLPTSLPLKRPCNLLWYVCSRGPLRPNLPPAHPSRFPFCPHTPHNRALHHPRTHAPRAPPWLARLAPGAVCMRSDPHRASCACSQGRKWNGHLRAATEPAILDMFSLIRHFRSDLRYPTGPGHAVSQDLVLWLFVGGALGWLCLLIGNKRLLLSSSSFLTLVCACLDRVDGRQDEFPNGS
jgi:hypothetical protein